MLFRSPNVGCTETNYTTVAGCHALKFTYQPASSWGGDAKGDRLAKITYYAPGNGGSWDVAKYSYDMNGQLQQEEDPRISPAGLPEKYTYYTEAGRLKSLQPPGEEPWTFEYGTFDGETEAGRLTRVKRPSLLASPSMAETTIAYGVPVAGASAPYDLSGEAVAKWSQADIPVEGTAIFPPDEVPATPPTSFGRATIYYTDAEAQLVNIATPAGAGSSSARISTTEHDRFGHTVRELTAQARLEALASGSESASRAQELDTKRAFSPDGAELEEEWGPLHPVRLESGASKSARYHRTLEYDKGAPTTPVGQAEPHLPTLETTGAAIPGQGIDADQRVTEFQYDWTLRKPTKSIVDPGGLNLTTTISYNEVSGLPTERRQPASLSAGDAHSVRALYYAVQGTDPQCQNALYAGRLCKVVPVQPNTPGQPPIPVGYFAAYSPWGNPTEVIEGPPSGEQKRKTVVVYDAAGRERSVSITGGGTPIPKSELEYSATNGRPTTQKFVCEVSCSGFDNQVLTTQYDALGRSISYQDADGNTATATYDLLGRPVTTSDGKGSQTRIYDQATGLVTELQDSAAGTFTASYNANNQIIESALPNGLVQKTDFDVAGLATHMSYVKTQCSVNCTWFDFTSENSIYGDTLSQGGPLSSQQFHYDKAGRLIQALDTALGGSCVTRTYNYDKDSNRTSLITRPPGAGGACDTVSSGSPQTYSYDEADRLLGTGMTYDDLGRITSLPSELTGGGGALATDYYSNDMVASQSQGSVLNSYQLDASGRQSQRLQSGGLKGTEIFHYGDGSDVPAWSSRGLTWSRNVFGISGELVAVQDSTTGVGLQIENLHGDLVAVADISPSAAKPTTIMDFDEFGTPKSSSSARYGWLGSAGRRTELKSGVVQMGIRSYVPSIGRFLTPDPIANGSANPYEYAGANPVGGLDLMGAKKKKKSEAKIADARPVERPGGGVAIAPAQPVAPPYVPASPRPVTPSAPRYGGGGGTYPKGGAPHHYTLGECDVWGIGAGVQNGTSVEVTVDMSFSCNGPVSASAYIRVVNPSNVGPTSSSGPDVEQGSMDLYASYKGVTGAPVQVCVLLVSGSSSESWRRCNQGYWVKVVW